MFSQNEMVLNLEEHSSIEKCPPESNNSICQKYGLAVYTIIDAPHRLYQGEAEKQRVQSVLTDRGIYSDEDELGLSGYVFLAYRKQLEALFRDV